MLQTHIIPIGNSLGIRLPKSVLDSLDMARDTPVNILMRNSQIILQPIKPAKLKTKQPPRTGWAKAFAASPATEVENLWGDMPIDEAWER
jgi:antitoxin component of MazEF toxin-antitoxin module